MADHCTYNSTNMLHFLNITVKSFSRYLLILGDLYLTYTKEDLQFTSIPLIILIGKQQRLFSSSKISRQSVDYMLLSSDVFIRKMSAITVSSTYLLQTMTCFYKLLESYQ